MEFGAKISLSGEEVEGTQRYKEQNQRNPE